MKHLRKTALVLIIAMLIALLPLQSVSAVAIGDKLGSVLNSDIKAFINDQRIPSYNIANRTVVVAEHLANYGFDVVWNSSSRTLRITLNTGKRFNPIPAENNTQRPGSVAFDYLYTDIRTYVNGVMVDSYNVKGQTVIFFDDLDVYGTMQWNSAQKHHKLNISSQGGNTGGGNKVGDKIGNVLNSDIKAFINGNRIMYANCWSICGIDHPATA